MFKCSDLFLDIFTLPCSLFCVYYQSFLPSIISLRVAYFVLYLSHSQSMIHYVLILRLLLQEVQVIYMVKCAYCNVHCVQGSIVHSWSLTSQSSLCFLFLDQGVSSVTSSASRRDHYSPGCYTILCTLTDFKLVPTPLCLTVSIVFVFEVWQSCVE